MSCKICGEKCKISGNIFMQISQLEIRSEKLEVRSIFLKFVRSFHTCGLQEARGKKLLFIVLHILFKMFILPLASRYLASSSARNSKTAIVRYFLLSQVLIICVLFALTRRAGAHTLTATSVIQAPKKAEDTKLLRCIFGFKVI